MKIRSSIVFNVRNVLHSPEFLISVSLSLLLLALIFIQNLLKFWAADAAILPSAALGWMGNYESMATYFWLYALSFILPVLATLLCADVFVRDVRSKRISYVTTRMGAAHYMLSLYMSCILFTFAFILAFMLISQLLDLLVFPITSSIDAYQINYLSSAADFGSYQGFMKQLPFGSLIKISPYLLNIAYMLYDAFYIAGLASISFAVSLYFKKSRILVISIPTIFIIVMTQVLPIPINPALNLFISVAAANRLELSLTLLVPCAFYGISAILVMLSRPLFKRGIL